MQSRSFTKLFASITDSSIWSEPDHIVKVWITMLAMADEHGIVDGTVPGLAARSRKTIAEVEEALGKFMSPDLHSRTREYEGRRVTDCPGGGWLLLNHEKYRAVIRSEALKQQKREWAARAREAARTAANDVGTQSPRVEKSRILPSVSVSGSDLDPEGGAGGNPKPPSAGVFDAPVIAIDPKRGTVAPADFEPTDTHRVRCAELKLDADGLLREFKLFEFNRPYSDWDRRFSRWIEDAKVRGETERGKADSGGAKGPRSGFYRSPLNPVGWEPNAKHAAFAKQHGIDLQRYARSYILGGALENRGVKDANADFGLRLVRVSKGEPFGHELVAA